MFGSNTVKFYNLHGRTHFPGINLHRLKSTAAALSNLRNDPLKDAKPYLDMPSPPTFPLIGSAWLLLPLVGRYDILKQHLANRHKRELYGDVWRERFGSLNIVISHNPDDMEIVYRNEGLYPVRGIFSCIKVYRESRKQWYKSTGLLILDGKDWQDLRKKTQKHLMKPKAIEAYVKPMQDVAGDFVQRIHDVKGLNNEVDDFLFELYKWSLESVALVGLDTRLGCLDRNVKPDSDGIKLIQSVQIQFEMMNKLEGFIGTMPSFRYILGPMWKKFEKASDEFSEIAFKYINRSCEKLKEIDNTEDKELTLLQAMLATEGLELGGAMVTVADMLFGGIDTTAHTAGFLLYELAKNPDKQEKLYRDVSELLLSSGGRITPAVLAEMKYLKACIKESLRLHSIIPVGARLLDHDVVISGYRVPSKTMVAVVLQETSLDERYFKSPTQFLPERWLNREEKGHPFAYMPFGFGPRSCIGRRLAEMEVICLIAEIVQRFKVEYHHEDIDVLTKFINTPDKPLRFSFVERR